MTMAASVQRGVVPVGVAGLVRSHPHTLTLPLNFWTWQCPCLLGLAALIHKLMSRR